MVKPTFNTIEVLALSIAAFKLAGNKIVRGDGTVLGNKELVINYITNGVKFDGCDNKELQAEAEELKTALSNQMLLNALVNKTTNSFLASVTTAIEKNTIKPRDIGLVVWAPKLFADKNKNENDRMSLLGIGISSKYVGSVSQKVELTFTLTTQKYLQNYNLFVHTGHDENGNLISFFNKSKVESGKITGKVKAHRKDSYLSDACVTVLNYVKVKS